MNKIKIEIEREQLYALAVIAFFAIIWFAYKTGVNHSQKVTLLAPTASHFVTVTPDIFEAGYYVKFNYDEKPVAHFVWVDGVLRIVGEDGLHGPWGTDTYLFLKAEVRYQDGTIIRYDTFLNKAAEGPFYTQVFRPENVYHKVDITVHTDEHGSWYWETNDLSEQIALVINLDGGALEKNGQFVNNENKKINLLIFFKDGGTVKCPFVIMPSQYPQDLQCTDKDVIPEDATKTQNPQNWAWFIRKAWLQLKPLVKEEIAIQAKFLEAIPGIVKTISESFKLPQLPNPFSFDGSTLHINLGQLVIDCLVGYIACWIFVMGFTAVLLAIWGLTH